MISFTWSDFLIGLLLMNAMPHLLFGLLRIRFLSGLGFSWQGNLGYAFLNVEAALILFHWQYGLGQLLDNGIVVGVGAMLLIYAVTGRFFYQRFNSSPAV